MSKRVYQYYIDESGHINNDSPVFLFGCIKTDTPDLSDNAIQQLRDELKDKIDFFDFEERINKGFHACDDHADMKTAFYGILPLLNFRAYFEVIIKSGQFFNDLKITYTDYEIISKMLENLIRRMILMNPKDKHLFYVEELEVADKSLKKILEEIENKYSTKYDIKIEILSKGDNNLALPDYINYNLFAIFEPKQSTFEKNVRASQRFKILKEKMAVIHVWNNDSFFSRKGKVEEAIEIDNLRKILTEV